MWKGTREQCGNLVLSVKALVETWPGPTIYTADILILFRDQQLTNYSVRYKYLQENGSPLGFPEDATCKTGRKPYSRCHFRLHDVMSGPDFLVVERTPIRGGRSGGAFKPKSCVHLCQVRAQIQSWPKIVTSFVRIGMTQKKVEKQKVKSDTFHAKIEKWTGRNYWHLFQNYRL